jgi:predicted MFS family arabinose efflux permease
MSGRPAPLRRLAARLGGPARFRVISLLAAVLALGAADTGMLGALARELEAEFDISHAQLGLLATVSSAVGALTTIPIGALADQVARVRLLIYTIALWSVALVVGGAASSYLWLLLSRLALGGAVAAAGPLLASLVGDLVPAGERAKIYGWILTGEMVGAGTGLLVGGNVGAVLSWRYGFWLLGLLGFGLAFATCRWLPEPARGGASRVPPGADDVPHSTPVRLRGNPFELEGDSGAGAMLRGWRSLWDALTYILRIRTIRTLIVASSIGYFFFAGLRTFIVVYVEMWYGLDMQELTGIVVAVGAGALAGAVLGGRLARRECPYLPAPHRRGRRATVLRFAGGLAVRSGWDRTSSRAAGHFSDHAGTATRQRADHGSGAPELPARQGGRGAGREPRARGDAAGASWTAGGSTIVGVPCGRGSNRAGAPHSPRSWRDVGLFLAEIAERLPAAPDRGTVYRRGHTGEVVEHRGQASAYPGLIAAGVRDVIDARRGEPVEAGTPGDGAYRPVGVIHDAVTERSGGHAP